MPETLVLSGVVSCASIFLPWGHQDPGSAALLLGTLTDLLRKEE